MKRSRTARLAQRIAVLVPCYNEEVTIGAVIDDFRRTLSDTNIYVFDNNSSDRTIACAREAGAIVNTVREQGKGNVIRRMFADIEADIYVLIDGDGTYDACAAPILIDELTTLGLDMVVASRTSDEREAYRPGHRFGNWLPTACVIDVNLFGASRAAFSSQPDGQAKGRHLRPAPPGRRSAALKENGLCKV
ncbi:glycosyltransferase family 2 protein [Rhizobium sp. RAF56]|uniref:glycosyltransferase family 2 protein n=1 Tax=Rhizobium sp. RAF56 TaxID=3233062 RepID=UPI003F9A8E9E